MGTKKKNNMNKVRVRTKKYHSTINKTNQQNQKTWDLNDSIKSEMMVKHTILL